MRKKSKFFAVCILVFWIVASMCIAYAATIPDATDDFYVNDFAGIFSEDEKTGLIEKAVNLSDTQDGIQVVVSTVKSLEGDSIESFANEMYNKYGIGRNDMGALILLSTGDRQIRIEVGYAMEAYITDSKAGSLIDKYAIPYLRDNKFSEGLVSLQSALISEISDRVQKEKETSSSNLVSQGNEESISSSTEGKSTHSPAKVVALVALFILFAGLISFTIFSLVERYRKLNHRIKELEKEADQSLENYRCDSDLQRKEHEEEMQRIQRKLKDLEYSNSEAKKNLDTLTSNYSSLQDYWLRANRLYPNLAKEVAKTVAGEYDSEVKELMKLSPDRTLISRFKEALAKYNNLADDEKAYVKTDIVKLASLHDDSCKLQKEYERQEKIKHDKAKAKEVQESISGLISGMSHGTASNLTRLRSAFHEYDFLDYSVQKYVDSSIIGVLRTRLDEAKRDKDRIDEEERRKKREEERRRREEEEEERRRRSSYSSSSFGSSSFGSSSHFGGFGGHSGGGGASRGF